MRIILSVSVVFALGVCLSSCKPKVKAPDVSDVKVDLQIRRFDQSLFSIDSSNAMPAVKKLFTDYPDFMQFYGENILGITAVVDSTGGFADTLMMYTYYPDFRNLYDSVQHHFPDMKEELPALTQAFKYFKHYFPLKKIPSVITYINGPRAFTLGDTAMDVLAIGIDNYMGENFPTYQAMGIPDYIIHKLDKPYLVPNCMQVMATGMYTFDPDGKNLLDLLVQNGKIIYFTQLMCPAYPDSIITGFTQKDLEWCAANEKEIWKFFIDKKLLYNNNPSDISTYVKEGPNTAGMPTEAPGNIGTWVGWQIISSYMKKHPEVTIDQLMKNMNSQEIFIGSGYKP